MAQGNYNSASDLFFETGLEHETPKLLMSLDRREFLSFLGAATGSIALSSMADAGEIFRMPFAIEDEKSIADAANALSFAPVIGPMPLPTDRIPLDKQPAEYAHYAVRDDLVLPEGFAYDVIGMWGDPVGDSRFGYNNDYLSFLQTGPDTGYLTINFEYISYLPWMQTFERVIGKALPFGDVTEVLKTTGKSGINAYGLDNNALLKNKVREISYQALMDQGIAVISMQRSASGKWMRTNSKSDRRITGLSGLEDGRYLGATGPAVAIFRKKTGLGYIDNLGTSIIGTFANCGGGTTPWGTILSAEENFQNQVPEQVYPDGTSFDPSTRQFTIGEEELFGEGNVFGLAGNKYGWIVEVDPTNVNDYGTKHTWLGRFRHEAVAVRVEAGKSLAFYSGDDRRGGHLYKFVSRNHVRNPQDKANSRLLHDGMLYAARFNPNGTGCWIPLASDTPVNPDPLTNIVGHLLLLPKRPAGGSFKAVREEETLKFREKFKTLGDLYTGNQEEQQGAILIDAHCASNAVGATATARPEDTIIGRGGVLFIAFTSGSLGSDGGPDRRIFKGPKGETSHEYGFIMRLTEQGNDPAALNFRWNMLALGGEPAEGGAGFSNPDNLEVDGHGNLWMVCDISSSAQNRVMLEERDSVNQLAKGSAKRGLFGNNGIWFIPSYGPDAGKAYLFGLGPMECELTGPFFTRDQQTLFLSVQHPGEVHGIRRNKVDEMRRFLLKSASGLPFEQTRQVPLGSNWPNNKAGETPKPAVVAIFRE